MRLAAVIPVKSFSGAKTRLGLPAKIKSELCEMMLGEIVRTVSASPHIDTTVLVTKEERAMRIASRAGAEVVRDEAEDGVNSAVALADAFLQRKGYDASMVLPQDIPYLKIQDIDFMLNYKMHPDFAIIVPSQRFDGTNALVRMPIDLMGTHYDDDSYRKHMGEAKTRTRNVAMVFVRRVMWDVDDMGDLEFLLGQPEKPEFAAGVRELLGPS